MLAISVAVHAVLIAWVNAYTEERPVPAESAPPTVVEIIEAPPPVAEMAPVDVAFLDEPAAAAVPELPAPVPRAVRGRDRTAAGAVITTGPASTEVATATEPAVRSPYLEMRRPGGPKIALPKFAWDPDMAPAPPPPEDPATGQLRESGNGTHKSDQGSFTAKVGKDGTVKLTDKKNFNIRIGLPSPKQLGQMIAEWYLDPNKPVGGLPPDHIEKPPVIDSNGTRAAEKPPEYTETPVTILSGGFDISDAFMRNKGQDPYASKKLAFLDSTRAERVQIGMKHRSEQLARAAEIMRGNLEQLWRSVAAPAARREALFDLWDEVVETGSDEMVAAGLQARGLVIGWIRARLPAGSPDAYATDELARLNARRTSKAPFAPY